MPTPDPNCPPRQEVPTHDPKRHHAQQVEGLPYLRPTPTRAMVGAMQYQAKMDRATPYWSHPPHAQTLDAVESWLASLADWLPQRPEGCYCDYSPETSDGPEEFCPHHGRPYAEVVEMLETMAKETKWARDHDALVRETAKRDTLLALGRAKSEEIKGDLSRVGIIVGPDLFADAKVPETAPNRAPRPGERTGYPWD